MFSVGLLVRDTAFLGKRLPLFRTELLLPFRRYDKYGNFVLNFRISSSETRVLIYVYVYVTGARISLRNKQRPCWHSKASISYLTVTITICIVQRDITKSFVIALVMNGTQSVDIYPFRCRWMYVYSGSPRTLHTAVVVAVTMNQLLKWNNASDEHRN